MRVTVCEICMNTRAWISVISVWVRANRFLYEQMNRKKNWIGERCECYIYICIRCKKKLLLYRRECSNQKKNLYVYICACAYKRENDAHFSVQLCMFREKLYIYLYDCIWAWVWKKKIEHLFSVNYYYFNEDIVCINPIDYANNHFFYFLPVTVKYTVKNRRIPFLFSYCIYFTLSLTFSENLISSSESVW